MKRIITSFMLLLLISSYTMAQTTPKTYYVSSGTTAGTVVGKNTNSGLTATVPLLTIQAAANKTAPGDIVYIMNGTYTSNDWALVSITLSGEPNKYITYTKHPGHNPLIRVTQWNGFSIEAGVSYIKIDGLHIQGNSDSITLTEAEAQNGSCKTANPGGSGEARFNGTGIVVRGLGADKPIAHHIVITNNEIHDCPGAGIGAMWSDYITIDDNVIYDNAWYGINAGSGISILESQDVDTYTGYKNFVRNNLSYGNKLLLGWPGYNCQITDGNGIIIDKLRAHYGGRTLVYNNIVANNGGSGISAFTSNRVDIINNIAYKNSQSAETYGEIFAQSANDVRIYNNIIYAGTNQQANVKDGSTNIKSDYNLYFNTTNIPLKGADDIFNKDPQFVSPTLTPTRTGTNFQLQSTSPAINAGSDLAGLFSPKDFLGVVRPQGPKPDLGAYEFVAVITNTITTGTISGTSFCKGASVSVPFTTTGTFVAGNVFTAQLSNASGSFATPVTIGTLTSTTSGTIAATIPTGTATGTAYRIRVVGSSPATTGSINSSNITINASVTPSVSIAASSTVICAGTNVTFTATPTNGGTTPVYQWKKNGTNVGTNSNTFSSATLANNDIITSVLTSNATCASQSTATSNGVTMTVNPAVVPSVSIAPSATSFCAGTNVTFTATPTNGGTTPAYQWKVNSVNVGTNATTFSSSTLANADVVTATLTSNAACASSTTATSTGIAAIVTSCGTGLSARYYDNVNFTGTVVERVDPTVNFTWGSTVSPAAGIATGTYSVTWDGYIKPQYTGAYTFYTTADDGIRLWVNSQLVIDNWKDQGPTEIPGTISLTAGQSYIIQIQYYNNTYSGTAKLSWSHAQVTKEIVPQQYLFPSGTGFGLWSTYYNNVDFTGTAVSRIEPAVNFLWGAGSPDATIDAETFSARWSGQVKPTLTETYTFYTYTDDGVRLWVNGVLLVDKWINQGPTEHTGTISLIAGQKYNIVMEYYENAVSATAQLSWSSTSLAKQIIPNTSLYPSSGATYRFTQEGIETLATSGNVVSAYPNPANDQLNVTFYSENESNATVELMTTMSQVVSRKSLSAVKGSNATTLDVRGLDAGMYLLNVKSGVHKSVKKIIIAK